jgi:energy-coupling factor transporter transmembrane protein EcfT
VSLFLARGRGPLAALHPVTKLVLLAALFVAPFGDPGAMRQSIVLALSLLLVLAAGGARNLVRVRVVLLSVFVASVLFWTLLGRPGGAGEAPGARFAFAVAMGLRFAGFLVSGVLYLTLAPPEEFTAALVLLGLPDRVAFAILLAFRWVPLLYEAIEGIREAQLSRGIPIDRGGPVARLRKQTALLAPAVHEAIRKAERTALVLSLRAFDSGPRTKPERIPPGPGDLVVTLLSVAGAALSVVR